MRAHAHKHTYAVQVYKEKLAEKFPNMSHAHTDTRTHARTHTHKHTYAVQVYKEKLEEKFPNMSLGPRSFLAAVMGDLTGSLWLCPSEVVKQKLQVSV